MYVNELQSFIFKFHQLWEAGVTAHLDLDTHAGQAWVGLRAQLGNVPGPLHQHQRHQNAQATPHRSPAYHRRQERRKAAKTSAADATIANTAEQAVMTRDSTAEIAVNHVAVINVAEKVMNENLTETEIPERNTQNAHDNKSEEETIKENKIADKAIPCDFCEKTFKTASGLKSHERGKHRASSGSPIPQVDGLDDLEDTYVKYAFISDYGEEDIEDSLSKIEEKTKVKVELLSRVRSGPLTADHNCVVRIGPVNPAGFVWPELDPEDAVVFTKLVQFQ